MSIPTFIPKSRSHFIGWQIFTKNRRNLIFYSTLLKERNHLQTVFLFWLFLFFFTQVGFLNFYIFGSYKRYSGLRVNLPSSSSVIFFSDKTNAINIWIDRNTQCVINDKLVKNSNNLSEMLKTFKSEKNSEIVYLHIDRKCEMDFPQIVVNEIYKIGFKKIVFVVKSSWK